MRRLAALFLVAVALGCAKEEAQPPQVPEANAPTSQNTGTGPTVGAGAALTGGAPVTTGTSVEGAGMGGIGQAAKDRARGAAGMAGAGSMGQAGGEGEGETTG